MAYTHGKEEFILFTTNAVPAHLSTNATALVARWAPGYMPFIVRAVSVQLTTTGAPAAGVISFRDTPNYGASTTTGQQFASITLSTGANNKVRLKDEFSPQEISPGDKVTAVVTTGATGKLVICRIYGEYRWESPANSTNVTDLD